jgi:proteasome lid subunit RPN8/RPN11
MTMTIHEDTLERIFVAAENSGNEECMGLLASEQASVEVTDMCLLSAAASATHAKAEPLALRAGIQQILGKKMIPRGIWHSHGQMSVFHSGTDRATMERLLPAMASWTFERPPHVVACPAVTAPDSAVLPLNDGRLVVFTVAGEQLPGGYGHELAKWQGVSTIFSSDSISGPTATFEGAKLALEGGGVRLELMIAGGTTVQSRVEDKAPYRLAALYSLVVNTRRERFAECLEVLEIGSGCRTWMAQCDVATVGASLGKVESVPSLSFVRALVGRARERG